VFRSLVAVTIVPPRLCSSVSTQVLQRPKPHLLS